MTYDHWKGRSDMDEILTGANPAGDARLMRAIASYACPHCGSTEITPDCECAGCGWNGEEPEPESDTWTCWCGRECEGIALHTNRRGDPFCSARCVKGWGEDQLADREL